MDLVEKLYESLLIYDYDRAEIIVKNILRLYGRISLNSKFNVFKEERDKKIIAKIELIDR